VAYHAVGADRPVAREHALGQAAQSAAALSSSAPPLGRKRLSWDHTEVAKPFQYQFEWDPTKAQQNLKDHGVAFERAATVFLDPEALSEFDEEHSQDENRWITLGLDRTGVLLIVCHTYREETETGARVRLISARKATKNETKQHERK
jgi:uncharacterized DUF497 family protein